MTNELMLSRLALIREIVDQLEDVGKTQVQKIVYFVQEAQTIPLGYSFRMHHYGPYSDEVDGDLSLAVAMGYVDISPDADGYGYHITPAETATLHWPEPLSKHSDGVRHAIDTLGSLETWRLELYATAHFVGHLDQTLSREGVIATVGGLKPKFSEHTIREAIDTLQNAGLIQA